MERREAYRYLVIRIAARGQAAGVTDRRYLPGRPLQPGLSEEGGSAQLRDVPLRNRLAAPVKAAARGAKAS